MIEKVPESPEEARAKWLDVLGTNPQPGFDSEHRTMAAGLPGLAEGQNPIGYLALEPLRVSSGVATDNN